MAGLVNCNEFKILGTGSGSVSLKSGATPTAHDRVFPSTQGAADTVMVNNGSGVMSDITLNAFAAAITGAVVFAGRLQTDDATDATNGTDGSLQTDGGLSVVKKAWIGTTLKVIGASFLGAGLSVGAGFIGTAAPTNGAIIEGNLGVGISSTSERFEVSVDTNKGIRFKPLGDISAGFLDLVTGSSAIEFSRASDGVFDSFIGEYETAASAKQVLIISGRTDIALGTNAIEHVRINLAGDTGFGTPSPVAKVHIVQSSVVGDTPVIILDQSDVSEEMIEFTSTIGTGNAIEAVAAKSLTTTHFIKATITGVGTVYIPCGTIA